MDRVISARMFRAFSPVRPVTRGSSKRFTTITKITIFRVNRIKDGSLSSSSLIKSSNRENIIVLSPELGIRLGLFLTKLYGNIRIFQCATQFLDGGLEDIFNIYETT